MQQNASDGSAPLTAPAIPAFTTLASDPTGIDTFQRYLWQTKLAVLTWLSSLGPTGPIAIVAEHREDLAIVEVDCFRFAQLKTKDRGSWGAMRLCGTDHAISRLIASYKEAKNAGILELSRFEVWLEGPPASDAKTKVFFADPTKAHADIKAKIRELGLQGPGLTDFLKRLTIHCHRPSRGTIDAVAIRAIGAAWPHMPHQQCDDLYEKLLGMAEAAQAASEPPAVVRAAIAAGRIDPADLTLWEPIEKQVLLGQHLAAVCPPLPSTSNAELLQRAATSQTTLLELKLVRAGAKPESVAKAIEIRAAADVAKTRATAGGRVDDAAMADLDDRILTLGDAVANLAKLDAAAAPAPAEFVFNNLMSRPEIVATDVSKVFDGDYRLVVGHLCGLSDECKFGWGHP
jgi:hypothetical protein